MVHVVHLRHELRRGVAELGCGDGRLESEIFLEVGVHSGPVVMLHVRDELVEVALHLNRRAGPLAVAVHERVVAVLDAELVEERQRLLGELPRRARLLRGAVLLHEPVAPELLEALAVHVVTAVKSPSPVRVPEGLLVVQLYHGDDGILQVVHASVGVHVRKQFLRILLLQLDQRRIKLIGTLVHAAGAGRDAVRHSQLACDVQIDVHVDAAFLELRNQVVLAVAAFGVELAARLAALVEDALLLRQHERAVGVVEVVEAHAVDAEAGETRGEALRLLVRGEVRGAGEVRRVELEAPLVVDEVPALHADASVLPGGSGEQVAHVHHIVRRVIRRHEREHPLFRDRHRRPDHHGGSKRKQTLHFELPSPIRNIRPCR